MTCPCFIPHRTRKKDLNETHGLRTASRGQWVSHHSWHATEFGRWDDAAFWSNELSSSFLCNEATCSWQRWPACRLCREHLSVDWPRAHGCEALRSFRLEKLKVYTSNHCQQIPGSNMTCEGAVLSDRSWSQDTFPKVEPKHYVWLLLRLPNKLSPCCGRISCAFFFEDTQPWPLTILKEISCRPLAAAVHSYPSCTVTRIH